MTHASMIEVIAAHRDGKEIEVRGCNETGRAWKDLKTGVAARDHFNFVDYDYRIKPPKPREWWILKSAADIEYKALLRMEGDIKIGGDGITLAREVLPSTGEEKEIL